MILLHRLTSFAIATVIAVGFVLIIFFPQLITQAVIMMLILVPVLFGRLLKWDIKTTSFWIFFGAPFLLLVSSLFFFLFLESQNVMIGLGVVVTFCTWLYAENVFAFYHLPSTYQAYALEYLSIVVYILAAFLFTSGSFAAQLFLQLPVWVPALAVFWVVLFATSGVFWVSKVASESIGLFALSGAVLLTELYIVLAMLPTSFLTNAAAFAVFLYLFLGLSRAHVLEKLSKEVLTRYIGIGAMMLLLIFASATWI